MEGDTMTTTQSEKAAAFAKLHERGSCFVIPNFWDQGSARLLEHLGFKALASSSAGFAFSIAKSDLNNVICFPNLKISNYLIILSSLL